MATWSGIPANWEVPSKFRDRLGSGPGRQRAMLADGHLLLVLHAVPTPDDIGRQGVLFWRTPAGDWTSDQAGVGAGSAALQHHLTSYAIAIQRLDERESQAQGSTQLFAVLEELSPIHRSASNLMRVLQDARKMVPGDRTLIDLRDRAYEIERTAELLVQEVRNALDFAVAQRAEQLARDSHEMGVAAHRLNLLVAFFFPVVTLSAVLGTNLTHGLEQLHPPWVFLAFVAVGILSGAVLLLFMRRKAALRASDARRA